MRDQLVALAKIAEMDASARDYDQELIELPKKIAGLKEDVEALEGLLGAERGQLDDAQRLLIQTKLELDQKNEAMTRARSKASRAMNIREADAAQREVESVRRSIQAREEEIANLEGLIAKKTEALSGRESDFDQAKQFLVEEETKANARLEELDGLRATALEGRDEFVDRVDAQVMRRYERLKPRLGNVVAIVDKDQCPACRFAIAAQMYIEIQRGDELHTCQNCLRMFVHKLVVD